MDLVVPILEDRQKSEDELVDMLESCQERTRITEVGQHNLVSSTEMSNAGVHRLGGQNGAMLSEFYQRRHVAEGKTADLASELQILQDRQQELELQLQGLREENTHVVLKASKLDQEVEELKLDKLRLSGDLDRLIQGIEKREQKLEVELRTCKEHVQSLEAEKLASVTLVDNLSTQVRELEQDKCQLTGLSNEASLSVQHLWEENTRLIEGYNRLEQEKRAHEEERMELVAGIRTAWEQLHAANECEALLTCNIRGLNERRDAEEVLFDQKLKDLGLKLEALEQEKSDLISKSEELSQILEALIQDSSLKLQDLQEEKDQLVSEVSELVKQREETEQAVSVQRNSWQMQVQGLESEKAIVLSTVQELEQQIYTSKEEVKGLKANNEKVIQLLVDLRIEITRLTGEVDKLEEVKERQEGERLELAADLQAAWDQILAVRDSEATIATELSELKDLRNEEKLRSDELVQDLRWQLREFEERTFEAGIKVEQLSKQLRELRKEQDLHDENQRLGAEIAMLEQERSTILTEKAVLLDEVRSLQGRVESLELDKNKMAFEIEELNQWLQRPAAEKKYLAENLDEITRSLKGLELERTLLTNRMSQMKEEHERMQKEAENLQDIITILKNEKAESLLVHEDLIRKLEFLEKVKQQSLKMQEDSTLLVQVLSEKMHVLDEELARFTSVHEVSLLRIQSLEEEKTFMGRLLEELNAGLNSLRLENVEHLHALGKFEGQLEQRQMEVQLLKTQVSSLEELNLSMKTMHDTVLSRLQTTEAEKCQAVSFIVALDEEKRQLQQSLEESELRMQGLIKRNSVLSEAVSKLGMELMERSEVIQTTIVRLSDVEEEKENLFSKHKELLGNLQVENLQHMNNAFLMEDRMQRTQAELQSHEEHMGNLLIVHQDTLLEPQALEEEKVEVMKVLDELFVQKLEVENLKHISQGEMERRLAEIQEYQETRLQLQILDKGNAELPKSLDASSLSIQKFQSKNVEHTDGLKLLKEVLGLSQAVVQKFEEKTGSLSSGHQRSSLLQSEILNEGKELLVNLSVQERHVLNRMHLNTMNTLEVKVTRMQAEEQRFGETERSYTAHQTTFLQQVFPLEKDSLPKVLDISNFSRLKLQAEISEHATSIDSLEEEIKRRQGHIQDTGEEIECLSTAHHGTSLQLHTVVQEKIELVRCLGASISFFQELQRKNVDYLERLKFFEKEAAQKMLSLEMGTNSSTTAYNKSLLQLQGLEAEKSSIFNQLYAIQDLTQNLYIGNSELVSAAGMFQDKLNRRLECLGSLVNCLDDKDFRDSSKYHGTSVQVHLLEGAAEVLRYLEGCTELVEQDFTVEVPVKIKCSKLVEKPERRVKLEMKNVEFLTAVTKDESEIFRDNVQAVIDYLKATVIDLGCDKDELANQLRLTQEQTCVIVAEKDQLSNELQVVREQLQEYVERLQTSENDAKKSKEEVLELSKHFKNFRKQVPKGVGCTLMSICDIVTEPLLDRVTMSSGQMEILHLTIDPREKLQQSSLGWVETITIVCQELANLLRSVGEENEKLARNLGMGFQKTQVLVYLFQELDRLILSVREKTERFAEELSFLKKKLAKFKNERFPLGSCADFNVDNYLQSPKLAALQEGEFMLDVETSCQTLQSTQSETTELQAHVANLSSYLADSQDQLNAVLIKSSTGNPYLLTSRADDGGHRKGLACISADDNRSLNYGSGLKLRRNITALDQEKKEKTGTGTVSSFTQKAKTPGRSLKKCKVNMQQPKRRWIF